MRFIGGVVVGVVLVIILAVVYIEGGAFDVAASKPHDAITRWVLTTAMRRSVETRAEAASPRLTARQAQAGFVHYDRMCVMCHGAPGVPRGELASAMRPEPPDLREAAEDWTPAQLHWIIKHGVKMSAMPAIGEEHSDEDIWSLVAFVESLPRITPQAYAAMRAQTPPTNGQGG